MPEYAKTAGVFRTFRANNDGKQVGDPDKAVKVILKAVDAEKPPLHLPLGARALRSGAHEDRGVHPGHRRLGRGGEGDRLRLSALAARESPTEMDWCRVAPQIAAHADVAPDDFSVRTAASLRGFLRDACRQ